MTEDNLQSISALELATPSRPEPLLRVNLDPAKPSAAVDAGSLVSFVAGISEQHRPDVLNSLLLAQLAASKRFDREKDIANWYSFYRQTLEQIGWVVNQQTSFLPFQREATDFTANEAIIESMKTVADEDEITVLQMSLNALENLGNEDERVVLFETQTHIDSPVDSMNSSIETISIGNFQIAVVRESEGVVIMKLGVFYFSTTETVTILLTSRFPSMSTKFFQGSEVLELNEDVYAPLRQAIVTKLGDAAKKLIGDIAI